MVDNRVAFDTADQDVTVTPVTTGVFPIRRVLSSCSFDGRTLDERGYVQLGLPGLPDPPAAAA